MVKKIKNKKQYGEIVYYNSNPIASYTFFKA